jgi:hypothetical protein
MNRRIWISTFLLVVWAATLWGIWRQQGQLEGLRTEHRQLQAQLAADADRPAPSPNVEAGAAAPETSSPALVVTPELLRLRSEVTQLEERKRELAGVRAENEALRAQFASRGTNRPAGLPLPPGYVRRSEARMVGYGTPDDTIQSLLWAIQRRDLTNLLQAFTPAMAEEIRNGIARSNRSTEDYFSEAASLPGMAILGRKELPDGSVELGVVMVPDQASPPIRLRQVNGQWKIDKAF